MDAKIDWLSFTIPLNLSGAGHSPDVWAAIIGKFYDMGLHGALELMSSSAPEKRSGRRIYGSGLAWEAINFFVWFGGAANHVLVEISGVGCQALRDAGFMHQTCEAVRTRVTRLDIAVDLPDAGKPDEFVLKKKKNRLVVTETHDTDTGWTQYVGSKASERFARVYLYREPHPRAGVLRVEHVLRSDYAKSAMSTLVDNGIVVLVSLLGNTFGWEHERWQPDETSDGKLRATRADKESAATLRWLAKAVAPALVKAHKTGLIDLLEWLQTHVLDQIEDVGE